MGYCDDCGQEFSSDDLLMTATGLRYVGCAGGGTADPAPTAEAAAGGAGHGSCCCCGRWRMLLLFALGAGLLVVFSSQLAQQMLVYRTNEYYRPIARLQAIHKAQAEYQARHTLCSAEETAPKVYAADLDTLIEADLLKDLRRCSKYAYQVQATENGWQAVAMPVGFEGASFFIDQSGTLRWSQNGVADSSSPVFDLPPRKKRCGKWKKRCSRNK